MVASAMPLGSDQPTGRTFREPGGSRDRRRNLKWFLCISTSHRTPFRQCSRTRSFLRTTCLILALLTAAIGCGSRPPSPPPVILPSSAPSNDAAERRQSSGYVGIDRCTECHRERVKEFRETRHFLACVEAAQVPMPAAFQNGRNQFASRDPDLHFEMSQSDGQYFVSAVRRSPQGQQRMTSRIDLVYGHAAGTDEAYFNWQDGRISELPMVWLHPQQCWASTAINTLSGGDYSRPVTAQCLNCHSTWVDCQPGSPQTFRRETALLGVTCERCHGPAGEHVTHHERDRNDRDAKAIVNPGSLSRERLLDLCAQCHDNAIRFRRPPFSYRPGDVLSDFVLTPTFAFPEDNHVANQNGGMRASRCFERSETMTCVTCHNPHRPHSAENAGSSSCAHCHQATDCAERTRLPDALQAKCIECHMPQANKVQVNFRTEQEGFVTPVKRWEHRIAIYPEARDAVRLEWLNSRSDAASIEAARKLAGSLGEFWRLRGTGFRSEFRFLMAIDAFRTAFRVDPSEDSRDAVHSLVKLQTDLNDKWFLASQLISEQKRRPAIRLLEEIVATNPRMAFAHARLGTLYAASGDRTRGVRLLQTAIELDSNDSYPHGMLGWLAYLDSRPEEALQHFQNANQLEPMNARLRYQLGLSLAALGRNPEAATSFRESLAINPNDLEACSALARILLAQHQLEEAIVLARRAVEITGERDGEALMFLSDCLLDAGQLDDARRPAEQALNLSVRTNPQVLSRARSRLQTLNSRVDSPQE